MKSALTALVVLAALVSWHGIAHLRNGGWAFDSDAAYLDQSVAAHIQEHGSYGVRGAEQVPALRDTLWRWMLVPFAGGPYAIQGAIALSVVAAALAVMLAVSLGRAFHAAAGLAAGLWTAIATRWAIECWSGLSLTMGSLLATGAVLICLRGFDRQEEPLPLSAAFLVGLACLLRIEFAVLWIAFWIHAMVTALVRRGEKEMVVVALRGLNGVLLIALLAAPVFYLNMKSLGVPWPILPASGQRTGAWSALFPAGLNSIWLKIAWGVGLALLIAETLRDRAAAGRLLPITVLVVLPPALSVLSAILGTDASAAIFTALAPLWIATAAFGAAEGLARLARALSRSDSIARWALAAVTVWIGIASLPAFVARSREAAERVRQSVDQREAVERAIVLQAGTSRVVLTDAPGWLLHHDRERRILDAGGQLSAEVLASVGPDRKVDDSSVAAWALREKADLLVLWSKGRDALAASLGPQYLAGAEPVRVARITRPAGP